MTLHYDNIDQIDWKAVKKAWDENFMYFKLVIMHDGHSLAFESGIDSRKKIRLCLYIDGWCKGEWSLRSHPYGKYHNKRLLRPNKLMKDLEALKKKREKKKYKAPEPHYYASPIFDNIAQIKKMVEGLKNDTTVSI